MANYEYKVIELKPGGFWGNKLEPETIETQLNRMAVQGWELVNSLDMNKYEGTTAKLIFIFKRPPTF